MKVEDHGIDGFDPLAHTPMEFTVQSAIDNLKSIRNKKVDLPIAVLESLKESLVKSSEPKNFKELETVVKDMSTETRRYHVGIPYIYNFYVDATSEEEAIEKAHNSEGSMGEYDEFNIFVEEMPAIEKRGVSYGND